jgi:hypothetical protein
MFSLRSALAYKYNPTIRYSVELYRNAKPLLGELRVSLRSQNSTLLLYLLQFCKLWIRIEEAFLGQTEYTVEDGRFIRKFVLRGDAFRADNDAVGEAIASYIDLFDRSLKAYFNNLKLLVGVTLIAFLMNSVLEEYETNFLFLREPPMDNLPLLNLDNGWYVYFLTLAAVACILVLLIQLPFMIIGAKRAKKALTGDSVER